MSDLWCIKASVLFSFQAVFGYLYPGFEEAKSHWVAESQLTKNRYFVPIFSPVQLLNKLQKSVQRKILKKPIIVFVIKTVMTDDQYISHT